MHKIFKLCGSPADDYWRRSKLTHATIFKPQHPYRRCLAETYKDFPSSALSLLDILLSVDPEQRGTSASALKSEVMHHPCCTLHYQCISSLLMFKSQCYMLMHLRHIIFLKLLSLINILITF